MQLFLKCLLVMFRFHFAQALRAKAVRVPRRDVIPFLLRQGHGSALADQDGPHLALKTAITARTVFSFMLAHMNECKPLPRKNA